jgi:Ring finger domain
MYLVFFSILSLLTWRNITVSPLVLGAPTASKLSSGWNAMSTSALTSPNLRGNEGQEKYSALLIAVSLMGVIIALLLVRLVFNLFIDLCILCDSELAVRNGAEFFRKVCPWWHRRTQPTTPETDAPLRGDEESGEEPAGEEDILLDFNVYKETLARHLQELLPCEIYIPNHTESDSSVRADDTISPPPPDLESELRTDIDESHTSSSLPPSYHEGSGGTPCSICLQALVRGRSVVRVARCGHHFHPDCLHGWLLPKRDAVGNNHCPNCRAPVVPPADLERLLTWVRRQEALRSAGLDPAARQRNRRLQEAME